MKRTRKQIHELNTLLDVTRSLLGEYGRIAHANALNDFGALIDEIEEIKEEPNKFWQQVKQAIEKL